MVTGAFLRSLRRGCGGIVYHGMLSIPYDPLVACFGVRKLCFRDHRTVYSLQMILIGAGDHLHTLYALTTRCYTAYLLAVLPTAKPTHTVCTDNTLLRYTRVSVFQSEYDNKSINTHMPSLCRWCFLSLRYGVTNIHTYSALRHTLFKLALLPIAAQYPGTDDCKVMLMNDCNALTV